MAGSLSHITDDDGKFRIELIENLGDAEEALEECHQIIAYLLRALENGTEVLDKVCGQLSFPSPDHAPVLQLEILPKHAPIVKGALEEMGPHG